MQRPGPLLSGIEVARQGAERLIVAPRKRRATGPSRKRQASADAAACARQGVGGPSRVNGSLGTPLQPIAVILLYARDRPTGLGAGIHSAAVSTRGKRKQG